MSVLLIVLMFLFPAAYAQEIPVATAETCPALPEEALHEMQGLILEFEAMEQNPHPGDTRKAFALLDRAFQSCRCLQLLGENPPKCGLMFMELGKSYMIESLSRLDQTSTKTTASVRIAPEDDPAPHRVTDDHPAYGMRGTRR